MKPRPHFPDKGKRLLVPGGDVENDDFIKERTAILQKYVDQITAPAIATERLTDWLDPLCAFFSLARLLAPQEKAAFAQPSQASSPSNVAPRGIHDAVEGAASSPPPPPPPPPPPLMQQYQQQPQYFQPPPAPIVRKPPVPAFTVLRANAATRIAKHWKVTIYLRT
jgi:hypothetical protein